MDFSQEGSRLRASTGMMGENLDLAVINQELHEASINNEEII